jgi:cytochrome P450
MSESWSVGQVVRRLLEPAGLTDPYSVYREIRAAADAGAPTGRFLFRYDDVRAALQDPSLSSDRVAAILRPLPAPARAETGLLEQTLRDIVVFTDQPDHRRLRRLLTQAFTPRTVELARPMIERVADELLDQLAGDGSGEVDLHRDLTYPLPAMVVAALLGIPAEDPTSFRAWVAGRLPLHSTATGKVILAYSPAALFDDVVKEGFTALTRHTTMSVALLRKQVDRVRLEGIAVEREEVRLGYLSTAVPVFGSRRMLAGALSITGPTSRLNVDRVAGALRTAAAGISRAVAAMSCEAEGCISAQCPLPSCGRH